MTPVVKTLIIVTLILVKMVAPVPMESMTSNVVVQQDFLVYLVKYLIVLKRVRLLTLLKGWIQVI